MSTTQINLSTYYLRINEIKAVFGEGTAQAIKNEIDKKANLSHNHGNLQNNGQVGEIVQANKNVVTDSNGKIITENKPTIPTGSSTAIDIKMDGTQAAGTSAKFARADHVHPTDTSRAAASHTHDDRYYTETEVDTKLNGKANSSHTHTTSQITDFPSTMTPSSHNHGNITNNGVITNQANKNVVTDSDGKITTEAKPTIPTANSTATNIKMDGTQSAGSLSTFAKADHIHPTDTSRAAASHTHDDRYYTETEVDTKLNGKANSSHTHDDRYYTETEINTKLNGKSDTSHNHDGTYLKSYTPPTASTSQAGIVQLNSTTNSTSTTQAATPSAVKSAYDLASNKTVTLTKLSTATTGYIATYEIKQGSTSLGKIDIPKDYLVKSGSVKTVSTANSPVNGYAVGDKYIDFVINTKDSSGTDEHVYINVKDLIDIYEPVTQSTNGLMTASDKTKLDGIATGANAYSHPSGTAKTGNPTANQTPAFGSTFTITQFTSNSTGHISGATDRTVKIPNNLGNGTTAGLSTNDYTTTEKNKLSGIATGATKNTVSNSLTDTSTTNALSAAKGADLQTQINNIVTGETSTNHNHNTLYYQKTEIDTKLDEKSDTSHTHDDRYYTETEINTKLNGKANSSHNQASSTITEASALGNLGTNANATQATINSAINTKIGTINTDISTLKSIKAIEFVASKPTASASTMNKLYIVSEDNKVNVYYTSQSGSTYSWKKMDTDILDELSISWNDITGKPSTFTPTSHTHGNITNDGKVGTTATLPLITGTGGVVQTGSFGTAAGTFCQGNDSRLSNARTPTSHTHGNITNAGAIGSTANLPIITDTNGVLKTGSFGTGANTFCQGNDSRLSNARTPIFNHIGATSSETKDLNNYTIGGFYYCNHDANESPYISNQPWTTGQKAFHLLVQTWGAAESNYTKQTLTYYTTGQTYIRTKKGSTNGWNNWIEVTKDTNTTYTAGTNLSLNGTIFNHTTSGVGAKTSGLYKTTIDAQGHITAATAIAKADITGLGIPAQDTTYSVATQSANGLLSSIDKKKLDGITESADSVSFTQTKTNGIEIGKITINGTSTSLYQQDNNTTYTPASETPLKLVGRTGTVGTSAKYAREDHAHPRYLSYSESNTAADGYFKLFRVLVGSWCNQPFVFKIIRRGATQEHSYKLRFTNVNTNTTLPTVSSLYNTGDSFDLWVYDNKDKTFDIIVKEPETYFECNVEFYDAMNLAVTDLKTRLTATEFSNLTSANLTKSTYIGFTSAEKTKLAGIATNANNYSHPNSGVTAGTNYSGTQSPSFGGNFKIPSLTFNAQGHITGSTTAQVNIPSLPTGNTSTAGIVQLNSAINSTSTTQAATPSAVKSAYDLANGKPSLGTTSTTAAKGDHNHDGVYLKSYTPPTASTSQAGIVQLTDSTNTTSSTIAATATAVKAAYDKGNHSHPYISTTAGSVGASNLASNAVEEAKIKDGAVTNAKISPTAITTSSQLDLNHDNYKIPGTYYCDANLTAQKISHTPWQETAPSSGGVGYAFSLVVLKNAGVCQILKPYNTTNKEIYIRNFYNNKWTTSSDSGNNGWYKLSIDGRDYTYTAGTGLSLSNNQFSLNHPNSGVTAGTHVDGTQSPGFGDNFNIPKITYNAQGHITGMGSSKVTIPSLPTGNTLTAGILKIGATANDAAAGNHTHSNYLTSHQDISGKVDKSQGQGNSGKFLKVNTSGNVACESVTIPTKTSQLTNDSNYLTTHQDISGKVDKSQGQGNSGKFLKVNTSGNVACESVTIPTKTSQLTNDSNFTTATGHNHDNRYYTEAELDTVYLANSTLQANRFTSDSYVRFRKIGLLVVCDVHVKGASALNASENDFYVGSIPDGFKPLEYIVQSWANTNSKGTVSFDPGNGVRALNLQASTNHWILANASWIANGRGV